MRDYPHYHDNCALCWWRTGAALCVGHGPEDYSDTPEGQAVQVLSSVERAIAAERARCVARVKHWFGGDSIDDDGYECVLEIENGKEAPRS